MHQVVANALIYATKAHGDQKRKYTGEPYICHCIEVAKTVSLVTNDETMIAAAILHDTVEDTPVSLQDICDEFGGNIAALVFWLTDKSKPEDGNRATRKAIDRDHISQAPVNAKTIKLADLISNTSSIVQHDRNFAKVYLQEKALLLDKLTAGNQLLYMTAKRMCDEGLASLGIDPHSTWHSGLGN